MPARPRKAYHHGNLEEALITAALRLIDEEGAKALSLREVARRAGVSHAAPYRHFENKEALLGAVAEQGFAKLLGSMQAEAARAGEDPVARYQAGGVGYVAFALAHPAHFRVMFGPVDPGEGVHPSASARGAAAFQHLVDSITACQRAGAMPPGDPMEIALASWSLVHGIATLAIEGRLMPGVAGVGVDVRALTRALIGRLGAGVLRGGSGARERRGS